MTTSFGQRSLHNLPMTLALLAYAAWVVVGSLAPRPSSASELVAEVLAPVRAHYQVKLFLDDGPCAFGWNNLK